MRVQPLILLGAGGHAKVLLDLAHRCSLPVLGVYDPLFAGRGVTEWRGLPVLGDDGAVDSHAPDEVLLVNGVGGLAGQSGRRDLYEAFHARGFRFATLVHPSALIGEGVFLGEGAQVMAGAVLQADTRVEDNAIINTRASIDHDCVIGPHAHVAPGAVLCGDVWVGESVHIGSGAAVIQGLRIAEHAVVGAGACAVRDLAPRTMLLGPGSRERPC